MIETKQECRDVCPSFQACQRMVGHGDILARPRHAPMAEILTEEGRYVLMDPETDEALAQRHETAQRLQDSGNELGALLLEGCASGPLMHGDTPVCASKNNRDVDFIVDEYRSTN